MALLYSKDDEQDCDPNGDSFSKRKMQGKKRRLDSTGDKQQSKVSDWFFSSWWRILWFFFLNYRAPKVIRTRNRWKWTRNPEWWRKLMVRKGNRQMRVKMRRTVLLINVWRYLLNNSWFNDEVFDVHFLGGHSLQAKKSSGCNVMEAVKCGSTLGISIFSFLNFAEKCFIKWKCVWLDALDYKQGT